MTDKSQNPKNWFDQGGHNDARFRPEYPPDLAAYLAEAAPRTTCCVDVGCGTGKLTVELAAHFDKVIGVDPSREQLAYAARHDRVTYLRADAEDIPIPPQTADLITAAQAAHWFDRPAFYAEARRLAAPGAVIALISYGVMRFDDDALNARFLRFYRDEIGLYWPSERKLVDSGYADIEFPFDEFSAPGMHIERNWTLAEFLGYLSTWSAVRKALEAERGDLLAAFAGDISAAWNGGERTHRVTWPVTMRIGRI